MYTWLTITQGQTQDEMPRSKNHKAIQIKNNYKRHRLETVGSRNYRVVVTVEKSALLVSM